MTALRRVLETALGLGIEPQRISTGQLLLRALIIFLVTLLLVRIAGRRFLAKRSAFDAVLGFIVASMMARAINGSAPFFGTVAAGFFVAILHRLIALAAFKSQAISLLLKGNPEPLVTDGEMHRGAMARHHISQLDLLEDLRLNASLDDLGKVKLAQLECNGTISVQTKPKVVRVAVQENVPTVCIETGD